MGILNMKTFEIDSIRKVTLGGLRQKIHIRGTRISNPVLLFLHGGPGVTNRHSIIQDHIELTDHFTVVAWDQRGTGGSYFGASKQTMTIDTFLQDLHELVLYLIKVFEQSKICLIGGSWGTELGIMFIRKYPELVQAYVGYGQVVNGFLNEQITYHFTVEKAKQASDTKALQILEQIGPPINGCYKPIYKGLMKQRSILAKYGGSNIKKKSLWEGTIKPILFSREYTLRDKIGIIRGYKYSLSVMWADVVCYDFIKEASKLDIPVYFFQGRLDNNTPSSLTNQYFQVLEAPHKELIWFEHSAHNPLNEEKEIFHKLLIAKLLSAAS
jgi:pimeloyl-ACP methyl ester carboxylesterase